MAWIEKFGHGGDLYTASAVFGVQQQELLDFSANINPLGPPEILLRSLREGLETIIHYPDPAHRLFRQAMADKLGIDPDSMLAGNGAAECMALVILALAPKSVGVVYPCFSEYAQLAAQFGAQIKGCYGREQRDFKPNEEDLYQLFKDTDLVFIGHPNNPTGILYQMDELLQMAYWAEEAGTYLAVDEAFLDFIPPDRQHTLLPMLEQFPRVLLIRSMTKFYAIPGLRLGFIIALPHLIKAMRQKQVTWSVNQLALLAGEVCIHLEKYEQQTWKLIAEERTFLKETIENRLGWKVWQGAANFLLVRLPEHVHSADLQMWLGRRGIMIRDCSMYPGLTSRDFRIAVRIREENLRLLQALEEFHREIVVSNRKEWGNIWG